MPSSTLALHDNDIETLESVPEELALAVQFLERIMEGRISIGRAALMIASSQGVKVDRAHEILATAATHATGPEAVHQLLAMMALQKTIDTYEQIEADESVDLHLRLSASRVKVAAVDRYFKISSPTRDISSAPIEDAQPPLERLEELLTRMKGQVTPLPEPIDTTATVE